MTRRYSWTWIGLLVLTIATALGLAITVHLQDAPAWWQAILSAAAVFTTAILWNLDRERARLERESDRHTLVAIVGDSIRKIRGAAQALHSLQPSEGMAYPSHDDLEALVLEVKHRWSHLALFSPYDRLGNLEMVVAVADVDAACRALVTLLDPPAPTRPINNEMNVFLPPRFGLTRLSVEPTQRSAAELVELSTLAIRTLRNRLS